MLSPKMQSKLEISTCSFLIKNESYVRYLPDTMTKIAAVAHLLSHLLSILLVLLLYFQRVLKKMILST